MSRWRCQLRAEYKRVVAAGEPPDVVVWAALEAEDLPGPKARIWTMSREETQLRVNAHPDLRGQADEPPRPGAFRAVGNCRGQEDGEPYYDAFVAEFPIDGPERTPEVMFRLPETMKLSAK